MKRLFFYGLPPAVALMLWEIAARIGWLDYRFFPAPSAIVYHLFFEMPAAELWRHLHASLLRIVAGYGLGALAGVALGIAMGLIQALRTALYPLVAALYPIPKIAVLPLIMLVFGIGDASKIVVVAIGSFFLVLINTLQGVDGLDSIIHDVAKVYRIRRTNFVWRVVIPGALPAIFTGLRLALGYSLVIVVAAEFSGANYGVGALIWQAWETFSIKTMYAGVFVIAALGIVSSYALDWCQRRLLRWQGRERNIG